VTPEQEAAIHAAAHFKLAELNGRKIGELLARAAYSQLDAIAQDTRTEDATALLHHMRELLRELIIDDLREELRAYNRAVQALQERATDELHDEE